MTPHFSSGVLALGLVALMNWHLPGVRATTISIDFTGIPDGTPLSAGNPYRSVMDLQAQAGYWFAAPLISRDVPRTFTEVRVPSGSIQNGVVTVEPAPCSLVPRPVDMLHSQKSVTATFHEPVSEVTFTALDRSEFFNFTYQGVDGNGSRFSDINYASAIGLSTYVLQAPAGGYLTQIELVSTDDIWWTSDGSLAGFGEFSLNSMELTFMDRVPEPSALADKAFVLLVLLASPLAARTKQRALRAQLVVVRRRRARSWPRRSELLRQ
jgi:hypothetical protein